MQAEGTVSILQNPFFIGDQTQSGVVNADVRTLTDPANPVGYAYTQSIGAGEGKNANLGSTGPFYPGTLYAHQSWR